MSKAAYVVIDSEGSIVSVDAQFCVMMRDAEDRLTGLNMLALTAPADHPRCLSLFGGLVERGIEFVTVKRLIRHDMSHVWIYNRATELPPSEGERRFSLAIRESAPPLPRREPSKLLDFARFMIEMRGQRRTAFGNSMFIDHAWDIICQAYVIEAEGGVLTTADLQETMHVSPGNVDRWIRALRAEELVDYEDRGSDHPIGSIRLSAMGHRKFERYLCQLGIRLTAASEGEGEGEGEGALTS